MFRRSSSSVLISFILIIISWTKLFSQVDCIIFPIENYIDTSENILICQIKSLVFDSKYNEIQNILHSDQSNLAKGVILQALKAKDE